MSKRLLVAVAMAAALTAVTVGGSGIAGAQKNAKVDPDKLASYLSRNEGASFSPSGILRVEAEDRGPINAARNVLEEIRV